VVEPRQVSITASATVGYSTRRWSLWAEVPIHHRRLRRCGNSPEHVSFHHASRCENRGGRAWASLTISAPCDPAASRQSPRRLLAVSAALLWRGAEAAEVADAMIAAHTDNSGQTTAEDGDHHDSPVRE